MQSLPIEIVKEIMLAARGIDAFGLLISCKEYYQLSNHLFTLTHTSPLTLG